MFTQEMTLTEISCGVPWSAILHHTSDLMLSLLIRYWSLLIECMSLLIWCRILQSEVWRFLQQTYLNSQLRPPTRSYIICLTHENVTIETYILSKEINIETETVFVESWNDQKTIDTRLTYGVAIISRLLKNIGLFCKNVVSLIGLFCKRDLCF